MDISSLKPKTSPVSIEVDAQGDLWLVMSGERRRLLDVPAGELQALFVSTISLALLLPLGLASSHGTRLTPHAEGIAIAHSMMAAMDLDDESDEFETHFRKVARSLRLIADLNKPETSTERKEAIIEKLGKFKRAKRLVAELKSKLGGSEVAATPVQVPKE